MTDTRVCVNGIGWRAKYRSDNYRSCRKIHFDGFIFSFRHFAIVSPHAVTKMQLTLLSVYVQLPIYHYTPLPRRSDVEYSDAEGEAIQESYEGDIGHITRQNFLDEMPKRLEPIYSRNII